MKNLLNILFALLLLLTGHQAFAQVDVRVEPVRREFLVGEPVALRITFVNHTDRTITLQNTEKTRWLNFSIQRRGQSAPLSAKATPKFPAVTLGPGNTQSFQVDLRPYYNFNHEGRYNVTATVVMDGGRSTRTSNTAYVTLTQGGTVQTFDIQARGQKLRVAVKLLNVDGDACLFGQVTDASSNAVLGACFLGKYLSFMKPCIKLDSAMNLHVLCQSTPEFFTYSVMNTYGARSSMTFYKRAGGPIDLISTGGGLRPIGLTPYTKKAAQDAQLHDASDRPTSRPR